MLLVLFNSCDVDVRSFNRCLLFSNTRVARHDTNVCVHVPDVESSSLGDVSKAKDGAVGVKLLIISACLQIGFIICFKDVGPKEHVMYT